MWAVALLAHPIFIAPQLHYALTALTGLFALLVGSSGILEFRRRQITIDPAQIDRASGVITTGIFRFTSNPMYLGLTALFTTWTIWLTARWTLLARLPLPSSPTVPKSSPRSA